jgi:hypothetical protein
MYLLNPSGDAFLCVSEAEWRLPFGTGLYLNSTVFLIFSLEFRDQFDGVGAHVFLGELDLRNFFYFLVGVAAFERLGFRFARGCRREWHYFLFL